ncbi:unnamed protein product [Knipowitschia caucasica]
MIMK